MSKIVHYTGILCGSSFLSAVEQKDKISEVTCQECLNKIVTSVHEEHKDNENLILNWDSVNGYGTLYIKYDGQGGYNVNTEFISIEMMGLILKKWLESKK